jgi:hypothetical protein
MKDEEKRLPSFHPSSLLQSECCCAERDSIEAKRTNLLNTLLGMRL